MKAPAIGGQGMTDLSRITICDCVTERTGVPHVFIPRAKYEALMAAAKDIFLLEQLREKMNMKPIVKQRAVALRAAGMEPSEDKA